MIMITATSRYASSTIDIVTDERGTHQSVNYPAPVTRTVTFTYYRVEAYVSVDDLAFDLYGSGRLWWLIADANPEILDWSRLAPGTVLRIPNG